jgi:hypothetical protein
MFSYATLPDEDSFDTSLEATTLTGAGASVASLTVSCLVAMVDATLSPGLGWLYAIAFVCVSVWVAARTRRQDLFTAAVLPPLAFGVAAVVAAAVSPVPHADSGLVGSAAAVIATMGAAAPTLFVGTALVVILAHRRRSLADLGRIATHDHERYPAYDRAQLS